MYNFTPDGNTFVNAGIVYDHDTNGNIKREVLTYRYEHFAINKVKMKTRNRYNISEHVEHAYEIQDIIIG